MVIGWLLTLEGPIIPILIIIFEDSIIKIKVLIKCNYAIARGCEAWEYM